MTVGIQPSVATIDNQLSNISLQMRNLMQVAQNLATQVGSTNTQSALAYLETVGYSNTPNASNPGGVSDAALALTVIDYFTQVSGVYYGTVQAGGSGGTGAVAFNINAATAFLWNGQ